MNKAISKIRFATRFLLCVIFGVVVFSGILHFYSDSSDRGLVRTASAEQTYGKVKFSWDPIPTAVSYRMYHGVKETENKTGEIIWGEYLRSKDGENFVIFDFREYNACNHYFSLTALDEYGNESQKSDPLSVESCGDPRCDNGIIDIINGVKEVCDRNSRACIDEATNYQGTQSCNANCDGWDACVTTQECGDYIRNGSEQCDDNMIIRVSGSSTIPQYVCYRNGYQGVTSCTSECKFGNCLTSEYCSDGKVQSSAGEECDLGNFGTRTDKCSDWLQDSKYSGTVSCNNPGGPNEPPGCRVDTSNCKIVTICGDGSAQNPNSKKQAGRTGEGDEECDKNDFQGKSCVSLGFNGGDLTCTEFDEAKNTGCTISTLGCYSCEKVCDGKCSNQSCGGIDPDCPSGTACCGNGYNKVETPNAENPSINEECECKDPGLRYCDDLGGLNKKNPYVCKACIGNGYCGDGTVQGTYGETCDCGNDQSDCTKSPAVAPKDSSPTNRYKCVSCAQAGGYCGNGTTENTHGESCDGGSCCKSDCSIKTANLLFKVIDNNGDIVVGATVKIEKNGMSSTTDSTGHWDTNTDIQCGTSTVIATHALYGTGTATVLFNGTDPNPVEIILEKYCGNKKTEPKYGEDCDCPDGSLDCVWPNGGTSDKNQYECHQCKFAASGWCGNKDGANMGIIDKSNFYPSLYPRQYYEYCDGTNLNSKTCLDFSFYYNHDKKDVFYTNGIIDCYGVSEGTQACNHNLDDCYYCDAVCNDTCSNNARPDNIYGRCTWVDKSAWDEATSGPYPGHDPNCGCVHNTGCCGFNGGGVRCSYSADNDCCDMTCNNVCSPSCLAGEDPDCWNDGKTRTKCCGDTTAQRPNDTTDVISFNEDCDSENWYAGLNVCTAYTYSAGKYYQYGTLTCVNNTCRADLEGCYYCGDSKINDGQNHGGVTYPDHGETCDPNTARCCLNCQNQATTTCINTLSGGNPLPGVSISINKTPPFLGTTDATGTIRISSANLPCINTGFYTITASKLGYADATATTFGTSSACINMTLELLCGNGTLNSPQEQCDCGNKETQCINNPNMNPWTDPPGSSINDQYECIMCKWANGFCGNNNKVDKASFTYSFQWGSITYTVAKDTLYETCDGTNLNGGNCSAYSYNNGVNQYYSDIDDNPRLLRCDTACRNFISSSCQYCGNNEISDGKMHNGKLYSDQEEECDGTNIGTTSCVSLGYYSGVLACGTDCKYNDNGCCGNDRINSPEICDKSQLNGKSCSDFRAPTGNYFHTDASSTPRLLSCTNTCNAFATSTCTYCGDDVVNGPATSPEKCDWGVTGTTINTSKTCASIYSNAATRQDVYYKSVTVGSVTTRYYRDQGNASCTGTCGTYSTSSCYYKATCGTASQNLQYGSIDPPSSNLCAGAGDAGSVSETTVGGVVYYTWKCTGSNNSATNDDTADFADSTQSYTNACRVKKNLGGHIRGTVTTFDADYWQDVSGGVLFTLYRKIGGSFIAVASTTYFDASYHYSMNGIFQNEEYRITAQKARYITTNVHFIARTNGDIIMRLLLLVRSDQYGLKIRTSPAGGVIWNDWIETKCESKTLSWSWGRKDVDGWLAEQGSGSGFILSYRAKAPQCTATGHKYALNKNTSTVPSNLLIDIYATENVMLHSISYGSELTGKFPMNCANGSSATLLSLDMVNGTVSFIGECNDDKMTQIPRINDRYGQSTQTPINYASGKFQLLSN